MSPNFFLVKAAYLQFAPEYLAVERNLQSVQDQLGSVEADLIVLPELFTSGYFFQSREHVESVAEEVPAGPTTQALLTWSESLGATLVAALAERDGEEIYNSAITVQPSGAVGVYRKVHLYYEEKTLFEPGDLGFRVFDVGTTNGTSYRLGVMVCFDWYFPEAARSLAFKGADVIAHPSNLVLPYCPDSMPVRARENHVFTITANRYGTEEKGDESLTFTGLSEVCDPSGTIRKRAPESGDEVGIVEIDPLASRDRRINRYNEIFADRRPEMYTEESRRAYQEEAIR